MCDADDIGKRSPRTVVLLHLEQVRFCFAKGKQLSVVLTDSFDVAFSLYLSKVISHDGTWLAYIAEVQHATQRIDHAALAQRRSLRSWKLRLAKVGKLLTVEATHAANRLQH